VGQGSCVDVALLDSQSALLLYRAVYYFIAGPGKSLRHQDLAYLSRTYWGI
jgi:hypothetical protein